MFLALCALATTLSSQFGFESVETTYLNDGYAWICVYLEEGPEAVAVPAVEEEVTVAAVADEVVRPDSFEGPEVLQAAVEEEPAQSVMAQLEEDLGPAVTVAEEASVLAAPQTEPIEDDVQNTEIAAELPADLLNAWPALSENTRDSILMLIEADLMTQE